MTAVIEAKALGKQYGRRWALTDCTLEVPAGQVVRARVQSAARRG
jgi:ABC-2 type transport system ATP-binding protein